MNATPSSPEILTLDAATAAGRSCFARWHWPPAHVLMVAVAAVVAWSQPVLAQQTYTWAGNGTQLWSNSAGWVGAPATLTFNTQTDIIFDNDTVVDRSNAVSISGNRVIRSLSIGANYVGSSTASFDIRTFTTFAGPTGANLRFEAAAGNASITVAQSTSGAVQVRLGSSDAGNVVIFSNLDLAQNNTFFGNTGFQFESAVSGAGAINKTGAGLVRMVRNNGSWSGGMNINEGEVAVFANGNAMGTGTWTLGGGANNTTFSVGSTASQNNTGGLVVAAGAGTRTIALMSTTGGNPTLAGAITLNKDVIFSIDQYVAGTHDRINVSGAVGGTGGIVKTGSGILVLSASNSYSGTTDIQSGKFFLGGAGRLGSGDVTIASGANLDFGTGTGQTNIVANNISGAGQIIQSTASTDTRITGNVTSTGGLTIENGTVRIGNGGTTGSYTGDAVVSSGATLAFDRSNAYTHNGTISGAGGISKVNEGDVTLTGNNGYTGGTSLFSGALVADHANALGNGGTITFSSLGGNTGTIRYTAASAGTDWGSRIKNSTGTIRLDTAGNNVSLAGVIDSTNTNGLVKSGSGVLTLGGANTYTGTTTVSTGGLLVNGSLATTGLASVASGARIGGTGSLAGGLSILSGGLFVFNPADPTLDVTGAVTLDNSFSVASLVDSAGTAINWGSVADGTYQLIGTTASSFANISNFGSGAAADIGGGRTAYFTDGSLNLVVVPEPSTVALLGGLAATGVLLARRRLARG
jgi:fibronectin-binding autotransporter adhesin